MNQDVIQFTLYVDLLRSFSSTICKTEARTVDIYRRQTQTLAVKQSPVVTDLAIKTVHLTDVEL